MRLGPLTTFLMVSLLYLVTTAAAAPPEAFQPPLIPASRDGQTAIARFRVPNGMKVELVAAEPLLANPVAFCFDAQGTIYVAETYRHSNGVTDNRSHMYWLEEELAARTVADREALFRKHLKDRLLAFAREPERVRRLTDRDGDGIIDHATVFRDDFHQLADGIGSGLLARDGNVFFTCIPHLWRLRDQNGDGHAEIKESLHHGYGVHVAFIGHDLHGLRIGPDGRLYFTMGDRGLHVETPGRTISCPDTGAVLRCELDGSDLELYATGLRNPQELAFDDCGNLLTVDNNSDSGDRARVVYVMEGADIGWRMQFQYLETPVSRGPWNGEKLWQPAFPEQAAYIVPPLLNYSDGPSGLTWHPGVTALPEKFRKHFFLVDFRGSAEHSGVRTFSLQPQGAGFQVKDAGEFWWSVLATDVDFGPDGALYVCDWVEGWNKPMRGRIYRTLDPARRDAPAVRAVQTLLKQGFSQRPENELLELLRHDDQRVRQEAQLALTGRGLASLPSLRKTAQSPPASSMTIEQGRWSRLHALWALNHLGRQNRGMLEKELPISWFESLWKDPDLEVRAHAAELAGELRLLGARGGLELLLQGNSPRVRAFAGLALGKLGPDAGTVAALTRALQDNADNDPYLRHALVMGLTGAGDDKSLNVVARSDSAAVRRGALLAFRRRQNPAIGQFLRDAEKSMVEEAARAIHDVPIPGALAALATLDRAGLSDLTYRRAVNANLRLGLRENAERLAHWAGRSDFAAAGRLEALQALGHWSKPRVLDPVLGHYNPLPPRPEIEARASLRPLANNICQVDNDAVSIAAIELGARWRFAELADTWRKLVDTQQRSTSVRVAALRALNAVRAASLPSALESALVDRDSTLAASARELLAGQDPTRAVALLARVLESAPPRERQEAIKTLAKLDTPAARALLAQWLERLLARQAPAEIHLEILEAARLQKEPEWKEKLAIHEGRRKPDDPLAAYRETLVGGNAEAGARLFAERAELSCKRCHKVDGQGGEVGPDLSKIGAQKDRQYLLESIVAPNRQIAKGFDTIALALDDGQTLVGVLREETAQHVKIITAKAEVFTIPKEKIEIRQQAKSAMPEDLLKHLTPRDLRDLVEFLATRK